MKSQPIGQMLQRDFTGFDPSVLHRIRGLTWKEVWGLTASFGLLPKHFWKTFLYRGAEKQETINLPGELDQCVQIIQVPNPLFL